MFSVKLRSIFSATLQLSVNGLDRTQLSAFPTQQIYRSKVVNGIDDHTVDQKTDPVGNHRQRDEIEMSLKGSER